MRLTGQSLTADIASAVSASTIVLIVLLDAGTLRLVEAKQTMEGDTFTPAVLQFGAVSDAGLAMSVQSDALPSWVTGEWWIGRAATLYQLPPSATTLESADILYEGIIEDEPGKTDEILSIRVGPARERIVILPPGDPVNTTDYPNAEDAAMGHLAPLIYGTVEYCPLLGVQVPVYTTLAQDAVPDDIALHVADALLLDSAGTVVVDGTSYAYTARDDRTLMGVTVTAYHRQGTACAQSGGAVYLGAGHALTAMAEIRAGNRLVNLEDATPDLAAATATFTTLPTLRQVAGQEAVSIQFDELDGTSNAINGINAIQASTGSQNQTAGTLPTSVTDFDEIVFSRPTAQGGTSRIISATYAVTFAVTVDGGAPAAGRTLVYIGGQVVWSWQSGSVAYNGSIATISLDQDTDRIAVEVRRDGTIDGHFSVDVSFATRTVLVGNLDAAAYAVLRKSSWQNLIVNQTTVNADRGRITRARLLVEYFSAKTDIDQVDVYWDGDAIGILGMTSPSDGGTETHTVAVDQVTGVDAELQSRVVSDIASVPASQTDNSVSIPVNSVLSYTTADINDISGSVRLFPLNTRIALPEGVVAGTYTFTVDFGVTGGGIQSGFNSTAPDGFKVGTIFRASPYDASEVFSVPISAGQTDLYVGHGGNTGTGDDNVFFWMDAFNTRVSKTIRGTVLAKPTDNALTVGGGGYSGTPDVNDGTSNVDNISPVARVDGQSGSGNLSITIPESPRTTVETFDIPGPWTWAGLTAQAKLVYAGSGGGDVNILRFSLLIEYDREVNAPAGPLTAKLTAATSNPADVLEDLAERLDYVLDKLAKRRLKTWYTAQSWVFGRRIAEPIEASELLRTAQEQALVLPAITSRGLAFIRRLDRRVDSSTVNAADLMSPAVQTWAPRDDIHNDVTMAYRHLGGVPTRVLARNAAGNDAWALRSEAAIDETRAVTWDAKWINGATTAAATLAEYLQLNAPMRRRYTLALPYTFDGIEPGDIIDYVPDNFPLRVLDMQDDHGWLAVQAEEIPE